MERANVLVVGGGIAGLSTAWHLATRGVPGVVLVEREPTLGAHSTGRNAAILRTVGADPVTSEVALRGASFLASPPAGFSDVPLVAACGLLLVAEGRGSELRAWVAQARAAHPQLEARWIEADEVRRLAPHFAGPVGGAVHFPREGRIDVAALVDGFARGARRAGARVRTRAGVHRLLAGDLRVSGVELDDGTRIEARATVVAAGGWAGRLARAAGSRVELTPTRRHLCVTEPDGAVATGWPVVWSVDGGFYCRPESGGMLLCACDQSPVDPDACAEDPEARVAIAAKTARFLPGLADARARSFWCGMRSFAADERFLIGPDPRVDGLHWVAALGGHGMVCGPEVGRIAAARLAGEPPDELALALDPGRPSLETTGV